MTVSTCKNDNTYKALVCISSSRAIVFVSEVYSGSISDKELTGWSGAVSLLQKCDAVTADSNIQDDFNPAESEAKHAIHFERQESVKHIEMIKTMRIALACKHVNIQSNGSRTVILLTKSYAHFLVTLLVRYSIVVLCHVKLTWIQFLYCSIDYQTS